MKNYKLFAFTDKEKEAVFEKARNLGVFHGGVLRDDGEFVYIYIEQKMVGTGIRYEYFKNHPNEYISINDFLALPEPKKEFPFKAGDMVIVRDSLGDCWRFDFFSNISIFNKIHPFYTIRVGCFWGMMAPFEGNEDKPGTTDDAVGVWTAEDIRELYGTKGERHEEG
jgi:hypothetical protein